MSTAGVADTANGGGITIEIGGMGFEPAGAIVNVLELLRVREPCAHPLADGGHNQTSGG